MRNSYFKNDKNLVYTINNIIIMQVYGIMDSRVINKLIIFTTGIIQNSQSN